MLHRHPFVKAVEAGLHRTGRIHPGDALLIAVSGGADSVALLRALTILAPRRHWLLTLHVGHIHHHLRTDAHADAAFVADLAHQLDLPCHQKDVHPSRLGGNLEANARRLRYQALTEIAGMVPANAIATAHHGDDQLETMLMRLIRGASLQGLSGIRPRRQLGRHWLVRPMLQTTHAQAVDFLRELDQPWREDVTNDDLTRWRAKLRSQVLPILRQMRPDAPLKAGEAADQLHDAARFLHQQAAQVRQHQLRLNEAHQPCLPRQIARELPAALLATLLREQSLSLGTPADRLGQRKLTPILRAIRDPAGHERRFQLTQGITLVISADQVCWHTDQPRPHAPPGQQEGNSPA